MVEHPQECSAPAAALCRQIVMTRSFAEAVAGPHGGPDALGVPAHDLSSNGNACGPCPAALQALRQVDARHYPDPLYTALSAQLAAWHGVAPERIVVAASASEFIQRISTAMALQDGWRRTAWQPPHAYGDYAQAALAAGLQMLADPAQAALLWSCEPSSPLGQCQADLQARVRNLRSDQTLVLDLAYAPLRLDGAKALGDDLSDRVWRLVTPNKALGLTGVRAAYAIAPRKMPPALLARIRLLAPSWPLGVHGVALLQCWARAETQSWLAACRQRLRLWKKRQIQLLQDAGWTVQPSIANFFVASLDESVQLGAKERMMKRLQSLRERGIKLRDCSSFGLPGQVRMAVAAPDVQDSLITALQEVG